MRARPLWRTMARAQPDYRDHARMVERIDMAAEASIVPIIGGGPAGMSCALWLHNYGLHPVIVEQAAGAGRHGAAKPLSQSMAARAARRNRRARTSRRLRATSAKPAIEAWLDAVGRSASCVSRSAASRSTSPADEVPQSLVMPGAGDRDRHRIPRRGLARPGPECAPARGSGPRRCRSGCDRRTGRRSSGHACCA